MATKPRENHKPAMFPLSEDKQCNTCYMCERKLGQHMMCKVFVMPYFVWGDYRLAQDQWAKRMAKERKKSPKSCWGYCDTKVEYIARIR